jgi:uncharacterized membrane protein YfhO
MAKSKLNKSSNVKQQPKKEVNAIKDIPNQPDFFESLTPNNGLGLMATLLLLMLLFVFRDFVFGGSLFLFKDIASDTINVFYPQLVHIADYLATDGIPKWSFSQGLGQNILPFSIGDPFNWILYLMGKDNLAFGIAWVELLKIFTAGMLFYCFLRSLKISILPAIIGGILYAFSGFMIVGASWYIFTTQGAYIALMLWGFERLYQHKSWWMFTLSVFLFAFNFPFDLYLAALFLLVYSTLRVLESENNQPIPKKLGTLYLTLIGCGALGVLMSTFMLISTIDQVINSPRGSGESAFFTQLMANTPWALIEGREFITALGRLFSNDFFFGAQFEVINGQNKMAYKGWNNYLEAPAFYCGLSTLILLPQLLFHLDKRKKIIFITGLVLVLIPLFFPFVRNAIWLFSGNYYRMYSIFVSIGLLLWSVHALNFIYKKQSVHLITLLISVLAVAALMYVPFNNATNVSIDNNLRSILLFFLIIEAMAIAGMKTSKFRNIALMTFLVIIISEALFSGSSTYSQKRQTISKLEFTQKVGYNDETVDAMIFLKESDPTFYRVEKIDFRSGPAIHASNNDAKVQGYFSSPSYHSFNQKNYINFLAALDVIDPNDENQTRWAGGMFTRPLLLLLTSTKYAFIKDNNTQRFWFKDYMDVGALKILQNPLFIPFGFTYDQVIDNPSFLKLKDESNLSLAKQITLLKAITIAPEDLPAFQGLSAFNPSTINLEYAQDLLLADVNNRRAETMEMTKFSHSHITGTITTTSAKALFFSIPFDPSWTVKVDGKSEKLYLANMGFMAVPLAPGNHTIELEFIPPYWNSSIVLSLFGFILFGGLLWIKSRKSSQKLE